MARTAPAELAERLAQAAEYIEVGARYAHYKHPERSYVVKGIGLIESTEEPAVMYEALYGERLVFIRPVSNWLETVEVREGLCVPRFSRIEKASDQLC